MKTNPKRKIAKWQPPGECLACGSESGLLHQRVSSEKVVHGETFHVAHHGYECRDCGFTFLGPNEMDEAVRAAVAAYQTKHDLLTAQELRSLRKKKKWSQADLAKNSGLGIATIKRLELGCTVQTKANNATLVQCFSKDQPIGEMLDCEIVHFSDTPVTKYALTRHAVPPIMRWVSLVEQVGTETPKRKSGGFAETCILGLQPC